MGAASSAQSSRDETACRITSRASNESFSFAWPAAHHTWKRLTTSRNSPSWTASRCRSRTPQGQPIAQLQGQQLKCQGPLTKFGQYGKSGQTISDFLPWHQKMADDICVDSVDGHRADQPRSGAHVHEHRNGDQRPTIDGLVGHLWAGQRKRESSGFRCPDECGRAQSTADRLASMGGRFSAQPLSRCRVQQQRSARQLCAATRRGLAAGQRRLIDTIGQLNRHRMRIDTRPGNRHAAGDLRDGVSDANVGAGTGGFLGRTAKHAGHVRCQTGRRIVCVQLSAGASTGRTWRSVYPPLPSWLGSPRRLGKVHEYLLRLDRQTDLGVAD